MLVSLFVLASVSLFPAPANACSCITGIPVCEQLSLGDGANSRAVFEATVAAIDEESGPPLFEDGPPGRYRKASLEDIKAWMGEPGGSVTTTSMGGGDCGYRFEVGRRYLIDAVRNPATGALMTSICALTAPIEGASEALAYLHTLSRSSPGATVSGMVRAWTNHPDMGGAERTPLAGVRVLLNGPRSVETLTGADGGFRLSALPPGEYQLRVEVEGRPELAAPPPAEFRLQNPHACHTARVDLFFNGGIEGTVIDTSGAPVADLYLDLRQVDAPPDRTGLSQYAHTWSDELGRYWFRGLAPGRYVVGVNLSLGPHSSSPYRVAYVSDATGQPLIADLGVGELQQVPKLTISTLESVKAIGRVLWPDGRPASGCLISAQPLGEKPSFVGPGGKTDADGRFEFEVFKGVRYRLGTLVCSPVQNEVDFVGGGAEPLTLVLRAPR